MSTWMYLECPHGHEERPLRSRNEVGQHHYDLPNIFSLIGLKRKELLTACDQLGLDPADSRDHIKFELEQAGWADHPENNCPRHPQYCEHPAYFTAMAAQFIMEHPTCPLRVRDEYGQPHTEEEIND